MIELARHNVPQGQFEIMDRRDIAQLGQQYDAIVCDFCLPYLAKSMLGLF